MPEPDSPSCTLDEPLFVDDNAAKCGVLVNQKKGEKYVFQ
jgi:hypothetical protein